jgi:hypothetical protein
METSNLDEVTAGDEDSLSIVLDGENVAPDTVDAASLLRIGGAVMELLEKLADQHGQVRFTGLSIVNKCVAMVVGIDRHDVVAASVADLGHILSGAKPPPRRLGKAVGSLRKLVKGLPSGNSVRLLHGSADVRLQPGATVVPVATSITTFRGTLQRVGGRRPKALFAAVFQESIVLDVSKETAAALGPYLYKEMDVTAQVHYTSNFDIGSGTVLDFVAVDASRDAAAELRRCYAETKKGSTG